MSQNILNLTDENFQKEVLDAEGPVLVDFWAPWCGPCKMIAPILEQMADEYEGKIKICKLDVDSNKETPMKFNIRGIPTLIIFKNGDVESMKVGAISRSGLAELINAAV